MPPNSVKQEFEAARPSNAHIHVMNKVTAASIAYVATQVIESFFLMKSMVANNCQI